MNKILYEIKEVSLDDLIPFHLHSTQPYQDKQLKEQMNTIESNGLLTPIIVRPIDEGKYEIIHGHTRALAMRELGYKVILADVRSRLSDDEAIELFHSNYLDQHSFSDWNYLWRFRVIHYTENLILRNSHQGRRNDLIEKNDVTSGETRHKLPKKPRRSTTRDQAAHRLGISTATFSKYRSIIKLPDDLVVVLAGMLDEKKITFEAAYRISTLRVVEIKLLVRYIEESPDKKIDLARLKSFCSIGRQNGTIRPISKELVRSLLIPKEVKQTLDTRQL